MYPDYNNPHHEPDLGRYDPTERSRQMQDGCKSNLEIARKNILKKLEDKKNGHDKHGDVNRIQIDGIRKEVEEFREESQAFVGPCFTKLFRQLRSKSLKILQELDKINVTGKDQIRQEKKELISETDKIWKTVSDLAHSDVCEKCEVKFV